MPSKTTEYEPEQLPGLVYRLDDPDVEMLLFGTEKMVITGGTVPADAEAVVEKITDRLADLDLPQMTPTVPVPARTR